MLFNRHLFWVKNVEKVRRWQTNYLDQVEAAPIFHSSSIDTQPFVCVLIAFLYLLAYIHRSRAASPSAMNLQKFFDWLEKMSKSLREEISKCILSGRRSIFVWNKQNRSVEWSRYSEKRKLIHSVNYFLIFLLDYFNNLMINRHKKVIRYFSSSGFGFCKLSSTEFHRQTFNDHRVVDARPFWACLCFVAVFECLYFDTFPSVVRLFRLSNNRSRMPSDHEKISRRNRASTWEEISTRGLQGTLL